MDSEGIFRRGVAIVSAARIFGVAVSLFVIAAYIFENAASLFVIAVSLFAAATRLFENAAYIFAIAVPISATAVHLCENASALCAVAMSLFAVVVGRFIRAVAKSGCGGAELKCGSALRPIDRLSGSRRRREGSRDANGAEEEEDESAADREVLPVSRENEDEASVFDECGKA